MNWKDAPHLFANGKFEIKNDYGSRRVFDGNMLGVFEQKNQSIYRIEDYQLIARPIGDMTDKEWNVYAKQYDDSNADSLAFVKKLIKDGWLPHYLFLYLLSIGVYPFDDETDVIFKPKN